MHQTERASRVLHFNVAADELNCKFFLQDDQKQSDRNSTAQHRSVGERIAEDGLDHVAAITNLL